jgi:3alpha(or 20beta)-hydroxysteroid dehydrogenase
MKLENAVALVTGGAQGMGKAHVQAFLEQGARVAIADRLTEEGTTLAEELGEDAIFVEIDVASESSWRRAVGAVEDQFGPISVLVNNAGIFEEVPLVDHPLDAWSKVIGVNLTGTFLGMKTVAPSMKLAGHGSIVNISSVHGVRGAGLAYGYTASKWGIRGITKSAAIELAADHIRVNAVLPGFVWTPMTVDQTPEVLEIPLRRGASAEELARVVLFFASDDSSYITGTELVVDGGQTAGIPLFDQLQGIVLSGPLEEAHSV